MSLRPSQRPAGVWGTLEPVVRSPQQPGLESPQWTRLETLPGGIRNPRCDISRGASRRRVPCMPASQLLLGLVGRPPVPTPLPFGNQLQMGIGPQEAVRTVGLPW